MKTLKQRKHERTELKHFLLKGCEKMRQKDRNTWKFENDDEITVHNDNKLEVALWDGVWEEKVNYEHVNAILQNFIKDFDVERITTLLEIQKLEQKDIKPDKNELSLQREFKKYRIQRRVWEYLTDQNKEIIIEDNRLPF